MADELSYVHITGSWAHLIDDGMLDDDALPDVVLPTGKVVFTPNLGSYGSLPGGIPSTSFSASAITGVVTDGVLTDLQGRTGVELVAAIGDYPIWWTANAELYWNDRKLPGRTVSFAANGNRELHLNDLVDAGALPADVWPSYLDAAQSANRAEAAAAAARIDADRAEVVAETISDIGQQVDQVNAYLGETRTARDDAQAAAASTADDRTHIDQVVADGAAAVRQHVTEDADRAQAQAGIATGAATAAQTSATAAAASEDAAAVSAAFADARANSADQKASSATASAATAGTAASDAQSYRNQAESWATESENAAGTAAADAATATAAQLSGAFAADRDAAAASATDAAAQASAATGAATNATIAETNARNSAAAAASSETNAASSAAAADTSATDSEYWASQASEVVGSGVPSATPTVKGAVMLPGVESGELGGTYDHPTVTGWELKADLVGGKVPTSQIPATATTETYVVASEAERLALDAQRGDVAVQTGNPGRGTYILRGEDTTSSSDWTMQVAPTDNVSSVNGHQGIVVLGKGDIGLTSVDNTADADKPVSGPQQTALGGKADATTRVQPGLGLTGGGDLTADRTLSVAFGTDAGTAAQGNDSRIVGAVQNTRSVATSGGLQGGGTLTSNRTISPVYGTAADTIAQGNDPRITGAVQNKGGATGVWIGSTLPATGQTGVLYVEIES